MEKKKNEIEKKKKGTLTRLVDFAWTRARSCSDVIAKNYRRFCERFE